MAISTLKKLERAAMRWFKKFDPEMDYSEAPWIWDEDRALMRACAAHARSKRKAK